jgi:predicted MFS family arabinose efflux permease
MDNKRAVNLAILVAALGYFVDIYDLILFSVVRKESLVAIGVAEADLLKVGLMLLARQNLGMLIGGILWGILGDRRGRLSVLFGSILLYSLANLANGYVTTVESYAILRFIAGVGLAGELGAGITLVSELMHKESRGYGATLVASIGVLGAIAAEIVATAFDWRKAFLVGGVLGLMLLVLRVSVRESPMFKTVQASGAERGNFFALFKDRRRVKRYLAVIMVAIPIWYVIGILVSFSPEFVKAMGLGFVPTTGKAIAFLYGGLAVGLLSQLLKSRRRAIALFLGMTVVSCALFFLRVVTSLAGFYALCALMGFMIGYWAVFMMMAAEQFGTNLRATAATTAPNFVRGSVVLMAWGFGQFRDTLGLGVVGGGVAVGVVVLVLAIVSLTGLEETFGKDLDYVES